MAYYVVASYIFAAATAAYGAHQQGQTAKKVARNNQIMNEYAAQDAVRRGDKDARDIQRKAATLKGTQRSTMAARGLDLGVGSAAEILDDTDFFSREDAATARANAAKEAWSLRVRGRQGQSEAEAASNQANLSAFSTVLGAGGKVADRWYSTPSQSQSGGWTDPLRGDRGGKG